jgi:putative transposase
VHYWHPQLSSFVGKDRQIVVHFDPADLGKLYWVLKDKTLLEIPYAQTHRPSVSLWELHAANQYLRRISRSEVNEERLFRAIEAQRRIVVQASAKTRKARLAANHPADRKRARAVLNESRNLAASKSPIDYSKPPEDLPDTHGPVADRRTADRG